MTNNFIEGSIPSALLSCLELKLIDLAENSLKGTIPSEFGNLNKVQVIDLSENELTGSIPFEMCHSSSLRSLLLQTNKLTGNIPSEVAMLQNLTTVSLSYNRLKGKIPSELVSLQNIQIIHLHNNELTGAAPGIQTVNEGLKLHYITDCGNPSFHLANPLTCDTCTTCCNYDGMCQVVYDPIIPIPYIAVISFLSGPIAVILFNIFIVKFMKPFYSTNKRDPLSLFHDDSVYGFIFSAKWKAKLIYFATVVLQFLLVSLYLVASEFLEDDSDWQYSSHCGGNRLECRSINTRSKFGWVIFTVVTLVYLGNDLVIGVLQIHEAVVLKEMTLFFSGFIMLCLTLFTLLTTILYNTALAVSDTDLIMNAVILLFINDLDEKLLTIMQSLNPGWTKEILDEVDLTISELFCD